MKTIEEITQEAISSSENNVIKEIFQKRFPKPLEGSGKSEPLGQFVDDKENCIWKLETAMYWYTKCGERWPSGVKDVNYCPICGKEVKFANVDDVEIDQ